MFKMLFRSITKTKSEPNSILKKSYLVFCYFCKKIKDMLSINNLSVQFGKRILFDEVNTTFTQGNIYGVIGANGAGKSTFLKIISGEMDPTSGHIHLEPGKRMSVLNQNHNMFDEFTVLETVMMGNKILYAVKKEMDELYLDYNDKNADRIGELQVQFEEMNG